MQNLRSQTPSHRRTHRKSNALSAILMILLLTGAADGEAPSIVFDDRPVVGMPPEAMAQINAESNLSPAQAKELRASVSAQESRLFDQGQPITLREITAGSIKPH